jgi:hypothetical protein
MEKPNPKIEINLIGHRLAQITAETKKTLCA